MFQYISEIIKNISPRQRFFALVVTLFFILLMTIGNNIITAFTNTDNVLQKKIDRLTEINQLLNNQNRELQTIVIESQLQCTKDITQVRQDILREIGMIESQMNRASSQIVFRESQEPATGSGSQDTVMMSQQPRVIQVDPNRQVMSHIKKMKKKLQDDIDNTSDGSNE